METVRSNVSMVRLGVTIAHVCRICASIVARQSSKPRLINFRRDARLQMASNAKVSSSQFGECESTLPVT